MLGRAKAQRWLSRGFDCFSVGQTLVKCLVAIRNEKDLVLARTACFCSDKNAARSLLLSQTTAPSVSHGSRCVGNCSYRR